MRAGRLDRVIRLQRFEDGEPDWTGHVVKEWKTYATLRAQIMQANTEEFLRSWGLSTETAIIFRTRFVAGADPANRVVYEGIGYNIREVKEIGRHRGLEIRAVSTGDAVPPDPEPDP